MSLSQQEFTNTGRAMLGRAQAGGILHITSIVIGSGTANQPSDLWPLTQLIHQEMSTNISSQRDYGDGTLLVEGSILSSDAPHAFLLKEVGVLARIGSEPDRLYSVGNVFAAAPDTIDPAAPTVEVFKIKLIIDRIPTDHVIVQIGPSENVTGVNLGADTVGPGVYYDALGNVLRFKRLVEGANMDIHDSTDGQSIYIGMNVLAHSVDLYVPLNYPNPPAGGLLFPTIQAAHDYLLQFSIPPDKLAIIHIAAGIFTGAGNNKVYIWHPDASQIRLTGQPRVDHTITAGPNYLDATHKNVQIAGNISDLYVGQPVYLMNTDPGWAGGCYITAKSGSIVTLSVIKRDSRNTYNINNTGVLGACRLSYFPSVIYEPNPHGAGSPWTADTINLVHGNNGVLSNLCIIGGYHVIHMLGTRCVLNNIQCFGTGGDDATCIASQNLLVLSSPSDLVMSDCVWGITGELMHGHESDVNIIANGCNTGIAMGGTFGAVPGAPFRPPWHAGKVYLVHCYAGAANWGMTSEFGYTFYACNDYGFMASNLGCFIFGGWQGNWMQLNYIDLWASAMGMISYVKGGGPVPNCLPAAGLYGTAENSFIAVH